MAFNKQLVSKVVVPRGTNVNIRKFPSTRDIVLFNVKKGDAAGRTSGAFTDKKDGRWFQVTFHKKVKNRIFGYVRSDVVRLLEPKTQPKVDGEALVKALIKNDKILYHRLLIIADLIRRLNEAGIDVTAFDARFTLLIRRYTLRQNKLKESKLLKFQTGFQAAFTSLKVLFSTAPFIFGSHKVGTIGNPFPVIPIVIVAVISFGTPIALYFAFRPDFDESTIDLKESRALRKLLDSIDPKVAKEIRADLEKQIDKAFRLGKETERFDFSFGKIITPIIIGGILFFVFTKVVPNLRKRAA